VGGDLGRQMSDEDAGAVKGSQVELERLGLDAARAGDLLDVIV
jgi:hypothetical protein